MFSSQLIYGLFFILVYFYFLFCGWARPDSCVLVRKDRKQAHYCYRIHSTEFIFVEGHEVMVSQPNLFAQANALELRLEVDIGFTRLKDAELVEAEKDRLEIVGARAFCEMLVSRGGSRRNPFPDWVNNTEDTIQMARLLKLLHGEEQQEDGGHCSGSVFLKKYKVVKSGEEYYAVAVDDKEFRLRYVGTQLNLVIVAEGSMEEGVKEYPSVYEGYTKKSSYDIVDAANKVHKTLVSSAAAAAGAPDQLGLVFAKRFIDTIVKKERVQGPQEQDQGAQAVASGEEALTAAAETEVASGEEALAAAET